MAKYKVFGMTVNPSNTFELTDNQTVVNGQLVFDKFRLLILEKVED